MVQLRSCYFCGTAEAVTEYETLPNALQTDERSQRVALCDRCQTKLTTVMQPVVDALDSERSVTTTDRDTARPGADSVTDHTPATSDESAEQAEVTFSDDFEDGEDRDEGSPASTRSESSTDDAEATTVDDSSESDEGTPEDDTETTTVDADSENDEEAAVDAEDESSDAAATDDTGGDLDVVYHKVLRFLRNREFPIPRTEAETVAQSAYDLSTSDAATVIQRAIDRDVLDERDGELHRR